MSILSLRFRKHKYDLLSIHAGAPSLTCAKAARRERTAVSVAIAGQAPVALTKKANATTSLDETTRSTDNPAFRTTQRGSLLLRSAETIRIYSHAHLIVGVCVRSLAVLLNKH
jgi:hypothetical protein